mgnify:CR=1 FL=1
MEALERRLQIAAQSIEAFRLSLQFVETRYERGLTSVLDVRQARRVLAQAETLVPQFEQEMGIIQQQLSVLRGRYPLTRPARRQPEDYYKNLTPVPPGLPSDLLMRRPDIRAAEEQLKALNERVGVAKAARLPSITLTGGYGWSSEDLNNILRSENAVWNLTAGLAQRTVGPIHPSKPYYNSEINAPVQDLELARKYLAEAGWRDSNGGGTVDKVIDGVPTELDLSVLVSG